MPKRPEWLQWELEISEHAQERMVDRDLTEVDVRHMLQTAVTVRSSSWPKWEVRAWHRGVRWKLIVQPETQRYVVILVTVYPFGI